MVTLSLVLETGALEVAGVARRLFSDKGAGLAEAWGWGLGLEVVGSRLGATFSASSVSSSADCCKIWLDSPSGIVKC
jgi:hypothetical protein